MFEVFELWDDEVPRYIAIGREGSWTPSEPRLVEWLSSLDGTPTIKRRLTFSGFVDALRYRQWRVSQIAEWSGGEHPDWLLNRRPRPVGSPRYAARAVVRHRDGVVQRWASVRAAAAECEHTRRTITRWAEMGLAGWSFDAD